MLDKTRILLAEGHEARTKGNVLSLLEQHALKPCLGEAKSTDQPELPR